MSQHKGNFLLWKNPWIHGHLRSSWVRGRFYLFKSVLRVSLPWITIHAEVHLQCSHVVRLNSRNTEEHWLVKCRKNSCAKGPSQVRKSWPESSNVDNVSEDKGEGGLWVTDCASPSVPGERHLLRRVRDIALRQGGAHLVLVQDVRVLTDRLHATCSAESRIKTRHSIEIQNIGSDCQVRAGCFGLFLSCFSFTALFL